MILNTSYFYSDDKMCVFMHCNNYFAGGYQLFSINNQMVLINTGGGTGLKDKDGNPVVPAGNQPTVLAHISGTSQPVALPLSVVSALQAQAKLQQQQKTIQPQVSYGPCSLQVKTVQYGC